MLGNSNNRGIEVKEKVTIWFWNPDLVKRVGYSHKEELTNVDPFEIAREIFDKGFQVMIFRASSRGDFDGVLIGVDNGMFRQRGRI